MSTERFESLGGGPNDTPLVLKFPELVDFTIWSMNPAKAKSVLPDRVRSMFRALLAQYPFILVQGNQVKIEINVVFANVPDFESMVGDAVTLTQMIANAAQRPQLEKVR